MAKTIFSPEGLQEKQQELYQLPDEQLLNEARSLCIDFKNWLINNFELSGDQVAYLDNMPENFKFALGAQFGSVVIGRGPVTMDPPINSARKVSGGTVTGGATWNPTTGPTYSIGGSIKFGNP